jgi:ribosomal protein L11 methylase PrmA
VQKSTSGNAEIFFNNNYTSFRDPDGSVFEFNGRIFRTINHRYAEIYKKFKLSGFYEELKKRNFCIGASEVPIEKFKMLPDQAAIVVEHEKIPFITYPYEWTFYRLKQAAIFHLNLQLFCLEYDVVLKDASSYNIQFIGHKPIFMDFLSYVPYVEGDYWAGHKQFCEQFLAPLVLYSKLNVPYYGWFRGCADGIPLNHLSSLLPIKSKLSWNILANIVMPSYFQSKAIRIKDHKLKKIAKKKFPKTSYRMLLLGLKNFIAKLEIDNNKKTSWSDYADFNTYSSSENDYKKNIISSFSNEISPEIILDIGCNTGNFSHLCLINGARIAIGFDADPLALEKASIRADKDKLIFYPIYMDASDPSPKQGWMHEQRKSIEQRINAQALICLAFVHHMAIGKSIPLDLVINWIMSLAPNGIIEFVPINDETVQQMLTFRNPSEISYSKELFESAILKRGLIIKSTIISSSGRSLYQYKVNK